jgi:hypothetical protein
MRVSSAKTALRAASAAVERREAQRPGGGRRNPPVAGRARPGMGFATPFRQPDGTRGDTASPVRGARTAPIARGGLRGLANPRRHRKSGLPDLRTQRCRSRVNPRSVALHVPPRREEEKGKRATRALVKSGGGALANWVVIAGLDPAIPIRRAHSMPS